MNESKSKDHPEVDAIREQVRTWLEDLGWKAEERLAEEGVAWRLHAQNPAGQRVVAVQRSARPGLVILGGSVVPGGPHPEKLARLPRPVMRSFLWDLRFELLRQRYQFHIQGPGIRRVAFHRVLYWHEGVSQSRFAAAVEEIHCGVLTVQWMIQRLLDEPPPPEPIQLLGSDPVN